MSDELKPPAAMRYYAAAAILVIAMATVAVLGRYSWMNDTGPGALRLDRWTGSVERVDGNAEPQKTGLDPFFARD